MDFLDQAKNVRQGEELDLAKLEKYLSEKNTDWQGPLEVKQFPSGFSNLTYLIATKNSELVLRRPPFSSKVKTAHDMHREHFILSKLTPHYPLVPKPLLYCEDAEIIGTPFYLMERLKGIILRQNQPKELQLDKETAQKLAENFIDNLAQLHKINYKEIGLEDWGKPQGYVERQIKGWSKRYHASQTEEIKEAEEIIKWLNAEIPKESGATIVHNDYKYDNLVLACDDLTNILGILDWELATIGDPLMDVATSLGYWINHNDPAPVQQLAIVPTNLPGSLTREQLAQRYAEKTGHNIDNMLYYYCFALFKIATIAQQIYYRYAKGHTKDPRFALLPQYIKGFCQLAVMAIKTGKY